MTTEAVPQGVKTSPLLAAPDDAMRILGFDPDLVQAVVLTPTSAVAIAADYPEPYVPPQEA